MNGHVFVKCINACKLGIKSYKCHRNLSTSLQLDVKVALCGASGGVGQPLALLLKISPLISQLAIYDIANAKGVAADLSHINTKAIVTTFESACKLEDAVTEKDIVVITAGKPRKPGMSRNDLFKTNADIVREIATASARMSPRALLAIITNPVNSLIPVVAEVFKKANVYDPRKIFGVTTLDVVRASTFAAELMCLDSKIVNIPVIGGHSGVTIIPVLSQSKPVLDLPKDKIKTLTERIQNAGTEIVKAKAGKGSATLSTAYAAARFVFALCRGIKGEADVVECAYVASDLTDAAFFANRVLLGREGVKKNLGFGKLDNYECNLLNAAMKDLLADIEKGVNYCV